MNIVRKIAAVAAAVALGISGAAVASSAANPTAATTQVAGIGSSSRAKVVRALTNGQTIATYRYHTQSADEVGDVYYDTDWLGGAKRRAIITIHGGWWHNATRANSAKSAQKWLDAGYVVFNIDYRVAADHTAFDGSGYTGTILGSRWPAQRVDVALAYDWLKANAAQFNVDPNRVALYGFSAGGHIANTAAGYYGTSRFKASASISGIQQPHRTADIVMGTSTSAPSSPTLVKSFGYMTSALGCSYEPTWYDCGNKWDSFKPETYFGADKPALYAAKGDADPVEPIVSLTATEYWLDQAGQDHLTVSVPGRGHDEAIVTGTGSDDVARWNQLVAWMNARV